MFHKTEERGEKHKLDSTMSKSELEEKLGMFSVIFSVFDRFL